MTQYRLIGKTITAMYLRDDNEALRFDIKGELPLIVVVRQDCCSRSWVESIEGVDRLFDAEILAVEDAMYASKDVDTFDVLKSYALKVTTTRGHVVFEYRNSSSGYYGAYLDWPDDDEPNDYYAQPGDVWRKCIEVFG